MRLRDQRSEGNFNFFFAIALWIGVAICRVGRKKERKKDPFLGKAVSLGLTTGSPRGPAMLSRSLFDADGPRSESLRYD